MQKSAAAAVGHPGAVGIRPFHQGAGQIQYTRLAGPTAGLTWPLAHGVGKSGGRSCSCQLLPTFELTSREEYSTILYGLLQKSEGGKGSGRLT